MAHPTHTLYCPWCLQLRLFDLNDVDPYVFVDELEGWSLTDVRAFALDPERHIRVLAALSNYNIDVTLQAALASDPDEAVVLALLSRVDPSAEVNRLIISGPHVAAKRELARRNLTTATLQLLAVDDDPITRELAQARLVTRGVVAEGLGAPE
jgi:hypothetical protein